MMRTVCLRGLRNWCCKLKHLKNAEGHCFDEVIFCLYCLHHYFEFNISMLTYTQMHNYLLHKKKQTHFSPTDTWYDPTVHNAQAEAPAKINSMSISRGVCENQLGCHFYPSSWLFYVECISKLLWVPLSVFFSHSRNPKLWTSQWFSPWPLWKCSAVTSALLLWKDNVTELGPHFLS